MVQITAVSNPTYTSADGTLLDVTLTTVEYGDIPCTLHPADPQAHTFNDAPTTIGTLYTEAVAGQFGAVAAYVAPPPPVQPVPVCQLWQLQAVLTPDQWAQVMAAVAALNNPVVSAFAAHGTNSVPANSQTLIALAAVIGLSPSQLTVLVQQASTVAIP